MTMQDLADVLIEHIEHDAEGAKIVRKFMTAVREHFESLNDRVVALEEKYNSYGSRPNDHLPEA
jgi:hypothetical protein